MNTKMFLVLCALCLFISTISAYKVLTVPMQVERNHNPFASNKYRAFLTNTDGGSIPINNFMDAQYTVNASLGTPAQQFRYIADTGSSNVWVPGIDCKGAELHPQFRANESSTYDNSNAKPFTIHYGSGDATGAMVNDVMTYGGISFPQGFGEMTDLSGMGAGYSLVGKFDGILGMGFETISIFNTSTPFLNMLKTGQISDAKFAFYLSKQNGVDGELTLGGYNPDHCQGPITWVPLLSRDYWDLSLGAVKIGDQVLETAAVRAIADTGTSLLAAPTKDVQVIAGLVGATPFPLQPKEFIMSCNLTGLPDFKFYLGPLQEEFVLTPQDYVMNLEGQSVASGAKNLEDEPFCLLSLIGIDMPGSSKPLYILGDTFLRHYYTVFDYVNSKVGMCVAA